MSLGPWDRSTTICLNSVCRLCGGTWLVTSLFSGARVEGSTILSVTDPWLGRRPRFLEGTSCEDVRRVLSGPSRQPTVGREDQSVVQLNAVTIMLLTSIASTFWRALQSPSMFMRRDGKGWRRGEAGRRRSGGGIGILAKVATTPS